MQTRASPSLSSFALRGGRNVTVAGMDYLLRSIFPTPSSKLLCVDVSGSYTFTALKCSAFKVGTAVCVHVMLCLPLLRQVSCVYECCPTVVLSSRTASSSTALLDSVA